MDETNPYETRPDGARASQPEVDSDTLIEFANHLDTITRDSQPASQLTPYDNISQRLIWIANRSALLRYAAILLRLAARDPDNDPVDTLKATALPDQIAFDADDRMLCQIQHHVLVPEEARARNARRRKHWLFDRGALVGCGIVACTFACWLSSECSLSTSC